MSKYCIYEWYDIIVDNMNIIYHNYSRNQPNVIKELIEEILELCIDSILIYNKNVYENPYDKYNSELKRIVGEIIIYYKLVINYKKEFNTSW
jgi:hypothetical protein